jgi:hypothetical protein
MAQGGKQMRVGTRKGFAYHSLKLVLLANGNRLTGMRLIPTIDYRRDNRRFWLSAHNCQVPTPTSQNLEVEQQIQIFGAD